MAKKGTSKIKSNIKFVGWNFVAAGVLAIAAIVTLAIWLDQFTQHGREETLPNIQGLSIQEATNRLAESQLRLVVVDSTYSRRVALGTILEQSPVAGTHVKHDRAIYVTVNASSRKQVPLPDLRDVSVRQAEAMLRGLQFQVTETIYEPSEYKDLVLDIRMDSMSVEPGTRLEEGSTLTLVVGRGKGTTYVAVPDLKGKSLSAARSELMGLYLGVGATEYDEEVTDENRDLYIVVEQSVHRGQKVLEGTSISLKLSQDIEKAITSDDDEEEFF